MSFFDEPDTDTLNDVDIIEEFVFLIIVSAKCIIANISFSEVFCTMEQRSASNKPNII